MSQIVMYSSQFCPYCQRARQLLDRKGLSYQLISVDGDPQQRQQMTQKSGRTSVPQIWIDGEHIGGCDELYQLERQGLL